MKNIIWRSNGQVDLMGVFSPLELRNIASESERKLIAHCMGVNRNRVIDGAGWAEAAFSDDVDPAQRT